MAKRKRSSVTTMLASGAEKANLEPSPPAVSADAADGSYSNNPNGLDGPDGGYVERDASYDVSESDIDSGEDCSSVVPPVECPFVVEYRSSAKRRRGSAISTKKTRRASTKLPNAAKKAGDNTGGPPKQQDLDQTFFEDNSTVYYVTPAKQWDALKKYRHFVGMSPYIYPCCNFYLRIHAKCVRIEKSWRGNFCYKRLHICQPPKYPSRIGFGPSR
jgi:hypothetical protein